jgi:hypothetical protein
VNSYLSMPRMRLETTTPVLDWPSPQAQAARPAKRMENYDFMYSHVDVFTQGR